MKLLQLTNRLPWPPIDGGKKGVLAFVETYSAASEIDRYRLLCLCLPSEVELCSQWRNSTSVDVESFPLDTANTIFSFLRSTFFSCQPFNIQKYYHKQFNDRFAEALRDMKPDVIHFDGLQTAPYLATAIKYAPTALRVLRAHNVEYIILARLRDHERNFIKRKAIAIHAARLRRYESIRLADFDLIMAITETDSQLLRSLNPSVGDRIIVVPAGISVLPSLGQLEPLNDGKIRLLHLASMDWLPNLLGLKWFIATVVPLLDASGINYELIIAGKGIPPDITRITHPKINIIGFVDDIAETIKGCHIGVVPIQIGGGMRIKIIDYWAHGLPVISTSVGAEGLDDGKNSYLLIANTHNEFLDSIKALISSPAMCNQLRKDAYRHVCEKYFWPKIARSVIINLMQHIEHNS